jgi:hypothetical protein
MILSVIFAVFGVAGFILGVICYLSPYITSEIEEGGMIRFAGVELAIIGIVAVVASYGLWNLRNWSRILAMLLCGLYIVSSIVGLVGLTMYMYLLRLPPSFVTGSPAMLFSLAITSLAMVIAGLVIWYLAKLGQIFK